MTDGQTGPRPTTAGGMNATSKIIEASKQRAKSDVLVGRRWLIWLIIAMLIEFIGIIIAVWGIIANATGRPDVISELNLPDIIILASIIALIASLTFVITNKKLLKRNHEHSKRERMLRDGIIEYFAIRAKEQGIEQALASQIATMQNIHSESKGEERNQRGWVALLTLVPWIGILIQIYLLYILAHFDFKHNQRWHRFAQETQSAGQALGMTMVLPLSKSPPRRPLWLFLIAYILTLGLFQIYWYYLLLEEVNEHYKVQWQFEDQLIKSI